MGAGWDHRVLLRSRVGASVSQLASEVALRKDAELEDKDFFSEGAVWTASKWESGGLSALLTDALLTSKMQQDFFANVPLGLLGAFRPPCVRKATKGGTWRACGRLVRNRWG